METGSILKMINTKAKDETENFAVTQKHLKYILREDATNPDLFWSNLVDIDDIFGTFGFFAKAAEKNMGRPLKHLVLSYSTKGVHRLSWKEYLDVTKEIAEFYGCDYQMVAAVHNNIESRPHAHVLIDCFNISTEKKYSESVKELEKLKDFADEILEKYRIPKVLRRKKVVTVNERETQSPINSSSIVVPILPTTHYTRFPTRMANKISASAAYNSLASIAPYSKKIPSEMVRDVSESSFKSEADSIECELRNFFGQSAKKSQDMDFLISHLIEKDIYTEIYDFFMQNPEKTQELKISFANLFGGLENE